MKAKKKTAPTVETLATVMATAATVETVESKAKKTAPAWNAEIGSSADKSVLAVCAKIDAVETSKRDAAIAVATLANRGVHLKAGWKDFGRWFEAASTALGKPKSKATAARLRNAGDAFLAIGDSTPCEIPTDDLAAMLGEVKKKTRDPIAIGAALRTASRKFTEARKAGKTVPAALAETGLVRDRSTASDGLDAEGKAKRIVATAYAQADKNWAEARRLMTLAMEELDRQADHALRIAAGEAEE